MGFTSSATAVPTSGVVLDDSGNLCTVKSAFANVAASQTDAAIVAAVAGKKIRVLSYSVSCGATYSTVVFNTKPAGAGTAIGPSLALGNNGFGSERASQGAYLFQTSTGEGLSVTTGAGSTSGIRVSYIEAA